MSAWQQRYRSYDDAALEVLANAGLLRRATKDVEAGKLRWLENDDQGGLVEADGQQVRLDGSGVDAARCTCPANGCCKHILAAVIWLREQPADAAGEAATEEDADLALRDALAQDPQQLQKQAGKAATRKARQWLGELFEAQHQSHGRRLAIHLPTLACEVTYLAGGGFDGMLSETRESERKALHLAALALLFQAQGQPWAWPADSEPAPADPLQLNAPEQELLVSVQQLLQELLRQGLSHASQASAVQLRMLNLSARTEGLPRLAAQLRTLGGQINRLANRDDHISEREALVQMAQVHALASALQRAGAEHLPALRGRLRRDYQAGAQLDLLPLGAHWWTTPGGARGLTLAFWDLQAGDVLEASLARPDNSDPGFRREAVWAQQALWKSTPQQLCQAPLCLTAPRQADDGRLAAHGDSRSQAQPRWPAADARLAEIGIARWSLLREQLEDSAALSAEAPTSLLLRPARCQEAVLDEVRQVLCWTLEDDQGEAITLELPCTAERRERLDNLERAQKARDDIRAVLVRPSLDGRRRTLEPLALLIADSGELRCLSLDFESVIRGGLSLNRRLFERIQRLLDRQRPVAAAQEAPGLAARLVEPALDVLESLASCGRQQLSRHQREVLQQQEVLASAAGVELLAQHLRQLREPTELPPQALLASSHLMSRLLALG
ncbi:SWIM zinc finger family protein [Pseudomonas solani]|uniref:SWIM zinc finger family protein n=1 Tax=Pseudomonas solani TaxID=2731552 RepID=UPI00040219B4